MTGDNGAGRDPPEGLMHHIREMYRRTAYQGRAAATVARTTAVAPEAASPGRLAPGDHVKLPEPDSSHGPGLWDALRRRRSVREYGDQPLELGALSQVLWAACGVAGRRDGDGATARLLRTAPSAGARYPIEVYVIANKVKGLRSGLYHYQYAAHRLSPMAYGDLALPAAAAAMGQDSCRQAAAVLVLTAFFERTVQRYHERAWRYVLLDAGHVAQNAALAAAALGLGTCMIGAFLDDQVNELARADGEREAAVYMITVGHPNPAR